MNKHCQYAHKKTNKHSNENILCIFIEETKYKCYNKETTAHDIKSKHKEICNSIAISQKI